MTNWREDNEKWKHCTEKGCYEARHTVAEMNNRISHENLMLRREISNLLGQPLDEHWALECEKCSRPITSVKFNDLF